MQITVEHIKHLFPQYKYPADLADVLNVQLNKYQINTINRVAGFLSQCGHESNGFTVLKENLNYSAEGLLRIFKKYFPTLESAQEFARNPEKIANKVYGGRMGNGLAPTGEGYKFRGRGAIQLTGKDNYSKYASSVNMTLDEAVADLETLDGAIESACWYWSTNGINEICDRDDIQLMTKRINGGFNGLAERQAKYEEAKLVLLGQGEMLKAKTHIVYETVRLGSNNATVRAVQRALGLTADGSFGAMTEAAVKKWQVEQGLKPDGIVGPITIRKMLGE